MIIAIFNIALILTVYLFPAIIAEKRAHRHSGPIWVINIFLGWTFLAWVICLAWSVSNDAVNKLGSTCNEN